MKRKPDLSRLVSLDLSPTEAAILVGLLEGLKGLRGNEFGVPVLDFVDGTNAHLRLQLKQLSWPEGRGRAPFPV